MQHQSQHIRDRIREELSSSGERGEKQSAAAEKLQTEADAFRHRIAMLEGGRVVAYGAIDDVIQSDGTRSECSLVNY